MARPIRDFQPTFVDPRHQLGMDGEEIAIDYLLKAGYDLEAHRFKVGREEIDIVIRRQTLVAFVEVKTRLGTAFGSGGEAVGWRKRKAIGRVAEVWRARYGRQDDQFRFDVVEVFLGACHSLQVRHIEDAWRVPR